MALVVDKDRIWQAKVSLEGSEVSLRLYDTMASGLILKRIFLDVLRTLMDEHDHYTASDSLLELTNPEGEDFTEYAVFVVICRLGPELREELGEEHTFLFALRRDGNVQLVATGSEDLTLDEFSKIVDAVVRRPESIEALTLAYCPMR